MIVAGIGCRSGTSAAAIESAIAAALAHAAWRAARSTSSRFAAVKESEPGTRGRFRLAAAGSGCAARSRARAAASGPIATGDEPDGVPCAGRRRWRPMAGRAPGAAADRVGPATCCALAAQRGRAVTVHFPDAGPGRRSFAGGRDLIARCPICLYAGSIIAARIAACPPAAARVDTAPADPRPDRGGICGAHAPGARRSLLQSGDLRSTARSRSKSAGCAAGIPLRSPGVRLRAAAAAIGVGSRLSGGAKRVATGCRAAPRACRSERLLPRPPTRRWRSICHTPARRDRTGSSRSRRRLPGRWWCWASWAMNASCGTLKISRRKSRPSRSAYRDRPGGTRTRAEDFRDSALYDPDYRRRFRGEAP
jgi:precorrin-4/cobalt-precorrin-4 C11-methyltransferase